MMVGLIVFEPVATAAHWLSPIEHNKNPSERSYSAEYSSSESQLDSSFNDGPLTDLVDFESNQDPGPSLPTAHSSPATSSSEQRSLASRAGPCLLHLLLNFIYTGAQKNDSDLVVSTI